MKKKTISLLLSGIMLFSLAGFGAVSAAAEDAAAEDTAAENAAVEEGSVEETAAVEAVTALPKIDSSAWLYNADDDVYYQLGIATCENPADEAYETLAIFVPGAYMSAADNGDGTFTCEADPAATVGSYTAETAPIVMPINTPGYSAMAALTSYSSFTEYTDAGFVYVHAGCRGRDAGAPAGVTDLKAAVRYLRYTDDVIPGSAERIFTFGMSGGGAQSALMGSTGDSALYEPYLEEIGAVSGVSDAVLGSMCWCPITSLDSANEAYEWMMGSTRSGLSEEEQQISDALAEAYAAYVNSAGIQAPDGTVLMLEESEDGIYQAGSYYEYMKSVIETSLNNFLADTEFPYDASSSSSGRGGFGGMTGGFGGGHDFGGFGGMMGDGNGPPDMGDGELPEGELPEGELSAGDEAPVEGVAPEDSEVAGEADGEAPADPAEDAAAEEQAEVSYEDIDDITRNETTGGVSLAGTYETVQDYIAALNANGEWVTYDEGTNTATITGIADFVAACKNASKNLGAFDQLDAGQGENTLFGYGDGSGAHFDAVLAAILEELGSDYAEDYAADLIRQDSAGNTVDIRLNMYSPLYYLLAASDGYQSSNVATYWRIRTGIAQGDCALSTEMNLALALENTEGVQSVDFETVWGAGHTQAERSGSSTDNFIAWVNACLAGA